MRKGIAAVMLSSVVALSFGCATPGSIDTDSERVAQARDDVRLTSLLNDSRVTLVERDGVLVFGGSVDSLQDLNIVRDIADEMEEDGPVENAVVYIGVESDETSPAGGGS